MEEIDLNLLAKHLPSYFSFCFFLSYSLLTVHNDVISTLLGYFWGDFNPFLFFKFSSVACLCYTYIYIYMYSFFGGGEGRSMDDYQGSI